MKTRTYIISLLLVCATFIVCAFILINPSVLLKTADGVNVKGFASQAVLSDVAVWTGGVSANGLSQEEAYKNVKEVFTSMNDVFEKLNLDKSRLVVSTVEMDKTFRRMPNGNMSNEVDFFTGRINVEYSSSNIDEVLKLHEKVSELIGEGLSVYTNSPRYYYTGLEDLKIELLKKAVENAKLRAVTMTEDSGCKLGKIRSANQGVFQITSPLSSDTADYGYYDTSSYQKEVKCVVTVKFEVE